MEYELIDLNDYSTCVICEKYVNLVPVRFRRFLYDRKFSLDNLLERIFQAYEFLICEKCCKKLSAAIRCYNDDSRFCFLRKNKEYSPLIRFLEYETGEYINYRCFDICTVLKDIYTAINSKGWSFIDKLEYEIEQHLMDDYYLDKYETAFSAVSVQVTFPRTIPRPIDKVILLLIKAIKFGINLKEIEHFMKNVKL
ncbi:uncharacterized protein LOC116166172 [Photinus pyralis]|uniref:uncharacterized protein LOC116166172 n=1 Tax=Photinus pyralis TaxID=7054 RepID=UPI0012672E2F|nr:uncharacterized protein LOC116166172 [Photinus pyralis]